MRQLFTRNVGLKLLALALAVGLWLVSSSDEQFASFVSVPVEYKGLPRDLEISSDVVSSVHLEVAGTENVLGRLAGSRPLVIIDFRRVTSPGERTFPIDSANIRLPRGISLVKSVPSQLRFRFEKRFSKEVPVEVHWSGTLPEGYQQENVEIIPPTLPIVGPLSQVEATPRVVTDTVDLSEITGDVEYSLNVFVNNPRVRLAQPKKVIVKINVRAK